jgi:hypothetical protein
MGFGGKLNDTKVMNKYKKELSILLCHEIMVRISNGTAECVHLGISQYTLINEVARYLDVHYTNSKSWDNLASLHFFRLDEAIKHKCSLHETLKIATGLGETLEGCGYFSKAAQIYEEAAQYASSQSIPTRVNCSAMLVWHGNAMEIVSRQRSFSPLLFTACIWCTIMSNIACSHQPLDAMV